MAAPRHSIIPFILFCIADVTRGFLSNTRIGHSSIRCKRTDDLLSLQYTNNPNDKETPQERAHRIELVKQLQRTFYSNEIGTASHKHGTFVDLPLWRTDEAIQLPGHQSVVKIHEGHYNHMFQKIFHSNKPFYFGHLFLPGGSSNLDNPDYRLDGSSEESNATNKTGVLMQVTDYKQVDNDGSLVLVVQALERFRVVEVPRDHFLYTIATVELLPDEELVEANCQGASEAVEMMMAQDAVGECTESLTVEEEVNTVWGAAKAAAVAESLHLHPLEFRDVTFEKINNDDCGVLSPVAAFDLAKGELSNDGCASVKREAMKEYLNEPTPPKPLRHQNSPLHLWGNKKSLSCGVREQMHKCVAELEYDVWLGIDTMFQLQKKIFLGDDIVMPIPTQLLRLLPSEPPHTWPKEFILDRYLKAKVDIENAMISGTYDTNTNPYSSSSHELVTESTLPSTYPLLRRAHRLSFAVWILLESLENSGRDLDELNNIGSSSTCCSSSKEKQSLMKPSGIFESGLLGHVTIEYNRRQLLEMGSICERLNVARKTLDDVNEQLRQVAYDLR